MFLSLPDTLFPSAKIVFWCVELSYTPNLQLPYHRKISLYKMKIILLTRFEGLCLNNIWDAKMNRMVVMGTRLGHCWSSLSSELKVCTCPATFPHVPSVSKVLWKDSAHTTIKWGLWKPLYNCKVLNKLN